MQIGKIFCSARLAQQHKGRHAGGDAIGNDSRLRFTKIVRKIDSLDGQVFAYRVIEKF